MQLIRDTSPCQSLAIEVRVCYTEYPFGKSAFVEVITLALYEPKYEDLWFRQMMLADEDTMSYHRAWGGTIPWPEDRSPSIGLTCSLLSIVFSLAAISFAPENVKHHLRRLS